MLPGAKAVQSLVLINHSDKTILLKWFSLSNKNDILLISVVAKPVSLCEPLYRPKNIILNWDSKFLE